MLTRKNRDVLSRDSDSEVEMITPTCDDPKPLVLVVSCNKELGLSKIVSAGTNYLDAVRVAGAHPLVIPAGEPADLIPYLELADGILLPGSPSNVHSSLYGQDLHDPSLPLDPVRDAWSFPLIREALRLGVPLFAICRGFQEFNVALGGSLHQAVHEVPGLMDHRPRNEESQEAKFSPAHPVRLLPNGLLAEWLEADEVMVNSVHGQGIDRLAPGLRAEAFAPDGLIEAFTFPDAPGFNLAVQWHPEWRAAENPISRCLLDKFGDACQVRRIRKITKSQPRLSAKALSTDS